MKNKTPTYLYLPVFFSVLCIMLFTGCTSGPGNGQTNQTDHTTTTHDQQTVTTIAVESSEQPTTTENEATTTILPDTTQIAATSEASTTTSPVSLYAKVEITGFAFNPQEIRIGKGGMVTWTNMDSVTHTVTSDSGDELSSDGLSRGSAYSHTFKTAGTYTYHCSFHTGMKGTIIVE